MTDGTSGDVLDVTGAFERAYLDERDALLRLAFLLVRSTAIAEELTQDAFARLYQHWDEVEHPAGWVRTTLVRLCITWSSRQGMERERVDRLDRPYPLGEPSVDEVWDALARVRPERRVVLVLRYYDDLAVDDIAALVGCKAATVRTRVHRGLADLRKELER